MTKIKADIWRDESKRPTRVIVKGLTLDINYGPDGEEYSIELKGPRRSMPSIPEILALTYAKQETIEFVENIKNIENIETIESIGLIDEITVVNSRPTHEAEQGNDIDITTLAATVSGALTTIVDYTVPAGKTLLVYDWSAALADGDGELYGVLHNVTDTTVHAYGGGNRGFQTPFSKPKRFATGKNIRVSCRQDTGGGLEVHGHIGGILI